MARKYKPTLSKAAKRRAAKLRARARRLRNPVHIWRSHSSVVSGGLPSLGKRR